MIPPPISLSGLSTIAQNGVSPKQFSWKMFRSSDGKTCFDQGSSAIITNPAAGQTILLDHVNQEARVLPTPPAAPSPPGMPQPGVPSAPAFSPPGFPQPPKPSQVEDLGKRFIDGHEVIGKKFTFQPPAPPQLPALPGAPQLPGAPVLAGAPQLPGTPGAPQLPGAPGAPAVPAAGAPPLAGLPNAPKVPGMPGAPQLPNAPSAPNSPGMPGAQQLPPTVMEVWTATKLHVPLLSRTTTPFGQTTNVCRNPVLGEPPASAFQIPAGYKVIQPPAPPAAS